MRLTDHGVKVHSIRPDGRRLSASADTDRGRLILDVRVKNDRHLGEKLRVIASLNIGNIKDPELKRLPPLEIPFERLAAHMRIARGAASLHSDEPPVNFNEEVKREVQRALTKWYGDNSDYYESILRKDPRK